MKKILICSSLLLIMSCSQQPARIVYKGNKKYTKDYYLKNKRDIKAAGKSDYTKSPDGRVVRKLRKGPEPVVEAETVVQEYTNTHTVKKGDTLYGIAERNNISSKELIKANNLKEPYTIFPGQKLKVPSTKYYKVKKGDTLYSIARENELNLGGLVAANGLKKPYIIRPGDELKLPSSTSSYSISKVAKMERNNLSRPQASTKKITKISKPKSKRNSFAWPTRGTIISKFGPKNGGLYNDGINIRAKEGKPFKAAEDGVVAYVGNELRGYGNLIIVKHSGNWISAYAHCQSASVKRGDKVKRGQIIGNIGSTGSVKAPQLYFSLRRGRKSVNPEQYLL